MQYTTYYAMKKPENEDLVNIDDINDNADIIDGQLHEQNLAIASINNQTTVKKVSLSNGYLTITYQDDTTSKFALAQETGTLSMTVTLSGAEWTDLTEASMITVTDGDLNVVSQSDGLAIAETEGVITATADIGTYSIDISFEMLAEVEPTIQYSTDGEEWTDYTEAVSEDILSGEVSLYIAVTYGTEESEVEA